MTGRERLNAIMHREPADRLSWTTLVDGNTLNTLPENLQGNGGIDFYRHLGCDIFLLNGWGTGHGLRSPELRWSDDVAVEGRQEGSEHVREWKTPRGTLTYVTRKGHPVKYPVDSLEAVKVYREMWEAATFVAHDDAPALAAIDEVIGQDGIVTRFWGPSTIPRLLETDMGTQHFYYLLNDYPDDMAALIAAIHERELDAFRILTEGPCESVTLCENTSTYYISPDVYRRFNGPHVRDFVDVMHAAGKVALLHMCGHVFDILADIKQTGLDGVHALTPPPTGNCPWEAALDVLGEDCIIVGVLDPSVFCMGPLERIGYTLDALYTPRLRRANFVLWTAADGIAVPHERFLAVREWFDKNAHS